MKARKIRVQWLSAANAAHESSFINSCSVALVQHLKQTKICNLFAQRVSNLISLT